jgi:hypothetical protein
LSDFGPVSQNWVLPMDSCHIWSEMGYVWIFTHYDFVGYTYKQDVQSISYHWIEHCTCHNMPQWMQAFYSKVPLYSGQ